MAKEESDATWIDGVAYTGDDLTFREMRQMRDLTRELAPDGDLSKAQELTDVIPAFVCVIKRRTDPSFTVEQVLDMKASEFDEPEKKAPPRKRATS